MSTDLVIARLDAARLALSEARTIQDTKQILDVAAAAEIYAKRQKLSEESIAFAQEVKIEALRQLGEFLKDAEKAKGHRFTGGSISEPPAKTLADQGIDKKTSMLAQRLAALPVDKYEAVKNGDMSLAKATATPKPKPPQKSDPPAPVVALAQDEAENAAESEREVTASIETLYRIAEADDKLAEALAALNLQAQQVSHFEKENARLMNENAELRKQCDYWRRKAIKAVPAAA